jgi:hypothetical protein
MRGVFDRSELPPGVRVAKRAGFNFEPHTLELLQQERSVSLSAATHRLLDKSMQEARLATVVGSPQPGVHFHVRPQENREESEDRRATREILEVGGSAWRWESKVLKSRPSE